MNTSHRVMVSIPSSKAELLTQKVKFRNNRADKDTKTEYLDFKNQYDINSVNQTLRILTVSVLAAEARYFVVAC